VLDAARFADRLNGANEVLVGAHAPGDAVHDNAYAVCCHFCFSIRKELWGDGIRKTEVLRSHSLFI
jgi:hypothetical protein